MEQQRQCLEQRQAVIAEKIGRAKLFGVERFVEGTLGMGHHREEYHEEKYVGDIELPHPVIHSEPCNNETLTLQRATIDHACGVTRDQDKDLGSIGEHHRLKRKLRQEVVRQMIEKDTEEGKTAEKIQPEVPLHGRRMTLARYQVNPGKTPLVVDE